MEPTAFRKHLVAELDSVHRLAFHLTGNADEAAELTQQTCTRALQAADRFELRDAGMRPWLFKILHNCFYTKRGREQKAPALTGDLEWEVPQKPASNARPAWTLSQFDWQRWNPLSRATARCCCSGRLKGASIARSPSTWRFRSAR
jgi:DNA-directed RNA polymerase specialized sigma24 family protein